jgi:uncharacterized repeat protein (TIGR01451 family)
MTRRALFALLLLLVLAACFVTSISGPTVVPAGATVTYDIAFETDSSGANGTAYVFFDVPADWTFVSATYDANVNGANVSGTPATNVSTSGTACVAMPLKPGYQRLGFSQTFPTVTSNDSGVLHVTLTVGGAANPYRLEATGAGSFGGPQQQCNATRTLDVTVLDELSPPLVAKTFSPASIAAGDTSRLTVTFSNENAQPISGVHFSDSYPSGLRNATPANLANTCGGTASSTPGSVSLAGATIPPNGSCTVSIDVTAPADGSYTNNLPPGAVTSNAGSNAPAEATLTVGASSVTVPTASEWALLLMAAGLVAVAMKMMR